MTNDYDSTSFRIFFLSFSAATARFSLTFFNSIAYEILTAAACKQPYNHIFRGVTSVALLYYVTCSIGPVGEDRPAFRASVGIDLSIPGEADVNLRGI
jgi:hypothetical protein